MRLKVAALVIAVGVGLLVGPAPSSGQTFVGPANGGGSTGKVLDSTFVYNRWMFPITNGRVSFPDCTTYNVSSAGTLSNRTVTPNCTPGSTPVLQKPEPRGGRTTDPANPVDLPSPPGPKPAAATPPPDVPATAHPTSSGFAGPTNGGGWSGTLGADKKTFTYRGVTYSLVNGVVTFPDCSTFAVSPRGDLFKAPPATNCVPQGQDPSIFVGPNTGGGWSGTLAADKKTLTYRGATYPLVNGIVTFPDCSTYAVSPRGDLMRNAPLAVNCTPTMSGPKK